MSGDSESERSGGEEAESEPDGEDDLRPVNRSLSEPRYSSAMLTPTMSTRCWKEVKITIREGTIQYNI